jgi:SRSO17 transposase
MKQEVGRGREEKGRRKKTKVREKVEKSQNTVCFKCFVVPEGWQVGSLKRRVRNHLGR